MGGNESLLFSVTVDDEDPAGTCRVTLSIRELKANWLWVKKNYEVEEKRFSRE